MNKITFPEFNLSLNISQVAFSIGNLQIFWYSIFIVFAIALSLILLYFTKKKYDIEYEDLLEIAIYILVSGIIGARIFYVVFNLDYYLQDITRILKFRDGGLAIFGGIIAGSITAWLVCKKKKISFFNFCDLVVPYLALAQAIGRLGNFFNVEAYGKETNSIFRMGIQSEFGYLEVHPCFLYEMIGCCCIFIILKLLQKNQNYKGEILSTYLILYGVIRFFIEALRIDSLMLFSIKVSQIISIIIVVIGIIIYINSKLCRNRSKNVEKK